MRLDGIWQQQQQQEEIELKVFEEREGQTILTLTPGWLGSISRNKKAERKATAFGGEM